MPEDNSKGKDITVLFKMGLSRAINKLSLIFKLILLESLDKNIIQLKANIISAVLLLK